jgi:hypothetical protein
MTLDKLSKTQNISISKVKERSDVGHILRQSGKHLQRIVPPSQMVNKEYYVEILSHLIQRICRVRPKFQERGSWFLRDNVKPHTAVAAKQFLVGGRE